MSSVAARQTSNSIRSRAPNVDVTPMTLSTRKIPLAGQKPAKKPQKTRRIHGRRRITDMRVRLSRLRQRIPVGIKDVKVLNVDFSPRLEKNDLANS